MRSPRYTVSAKIHWVMRIPEGFKYVWRLCPLVICVLASSGCAKLHYNQWSTLLYFGGKAYVLEGVETDKTAPLLTADGTFKKFTFAVRRDFVLYEKGNPSQILGKFVQNNPACNRSTYDYFPASNTLVASYDSWKPRISNLSKNTAFRVKGLLSNLRQPECRFALTHDSKANRMYSYDKLTGSEMALTPEALAFVGDTWHTEFFLIENGRVLAKIVSDYSSKEFVISTWDLVRNVGGPKTSIVGFGRYSEPSVRFVDRWKNGLVFVYGGRVEEKPGSHYALTEGICEGGQVIRRPIYRSDHSAVGGLLNVVPEGARNVAIIHHLFEGYSRPARRWQITTVDLLDGATIKDQIVELQLQKPEGGP